MKNEYFVFMILLGIFMIISCEKEKSTVLPIQIETDRSSYPTTENVKVIVTNTSDSIVRYYHCSSYEGIPPNIYKLENNSWIVFWAPVCNGYESFCCPELLADESFGDTLELQFIPGTYKLEYQFIVKPGHDYQSFYSDPFTVE